MITMRAYVACWLAAFVIAASGAARAAYEWRAAWGAPYPLLIIGRDARDRADGARVELSAATPFGLPGVTFQSILLCNVQHGWECHAGTLRAAAYREWHAGVGKRWAAGSRIKVLSGLRVFGLSSGEPTDPSPSVALTALAEIAPSQDGPASFAAGVVDAVWTQSGERGRASPATLLLARATCVWHGQRLVVQRQASADGNGETIIGVGLDVSGVKISPCMRCGIGEAALTISIEQCGIAVTAGESWHPELGWTPIVAIGWHGRAR